MISLIVAVDEQYGIGKDNGLLCHLPADLMHFKTLTLSKPIIMGRKTFESIGRPLPGRHNIVLSTQERLIDGVSVVRSLDEALELVQEQPEIMVIGGATIFEQALPQAQRIYLTLIHHTFTADVFFPELDMTTWELRNSHFRARDENNSYDVTFCHYERLITSLD